MFAWGTSIHVTAVHFRAGGGWGPVFPISFLLYPKEPMCIQWRGLVKNEMASTSRATKKPKEHR